MKLLLTGDWHYTDKAPKTRTDDYVSAWFRKMNVLLNESLPILQPGDLTDSPFLNYLAFRKLFMLLRKEVVYTIYGQHDLHYRNKGNTPLDALLDAIPNLFVVGKTPHVLQKCPGAVHLYGASFGEEVPKIVDEKAYNILLIHKMISVSVKQDWEGTEAFSFLKKNKFNLIVSGDNHKSFSVHHNQKYLINCGSLMRSKIDQIEHKPCFYKIDTNRSELTKHSIPIENGYKVFDLSSKIEKEERNEDLEAFVAGLSEQKEMSLKVMDNLIAYIAENRLGEKILQIIKENAV